MINKQVFALLFLGILISSCHKVPSEDAASDTNSSKELQENGTVDSLSTDGNVVNSTPIKVDTLSIMVVPCANGYVYETKNYDLDLIIERELKKLDGIYVKPFPYKTLMGVAYQGVFDKRYCLPIIEKVEVDFLILNRFANEFDEFTLPKKDLGYEVRIVNTRTLEQINSIRADNLKQYELIDAHIVANIHRLKSDIETLK
ncbi:MAG: hypothetical protein AAGI38_16855 [Bacteroidota bacterium]